MTLKTVSFPLFEKKQLQHKAIPNLQTFQEKPCVFGWKEYEGQLDDKVTSSPSTPQHLQKRIPFKSDSSDNFLRHNFNGSYVMPGKEGVNLSLD